MEPLREKELVKQLQQGNQTAYSKLYTFYKNKIFLFAVSIVKIQKDAEDIVQQVFLNVWLKRKEIDSSKNLSSFLFTSTKNASLNSLRKSVQENSYHKDFIWQNSMMAQCFTDEKIEHDELLATIQHTLDKLSQQKQTIFKMSRHEGMTYDQIGKKLNISKNTVRNHMTESINLIKKEIEHSNKINATLMILLFWLFS